MGDERNAFEACGQGRWWVAFTPEARRELEELKISGWGRWPLRVRGTLSNKGVYGHLGMYERMLTVEHVLERIKGNPCGT